MRSLGSKSGRINVDRGHDLDILAYPFIESLIVADVKESSIFGVFIEPTKTICSKESLWALFEMRVLIIIVILVVNNSKVRT